MAHKVEPKGFVEHYVDYSEGRSHAPTLTVMVGVSGSGKSTLVGPWLKSGNGNTIRQNRDSIRAMLFGEVPWSNYCEEVTRRTERDGVKLALGMGRSVIVDDTNLDPRTRFGWEKLARELHVKFRQVVMTATMEECIERDALRSGKACVGVDVIKKQFKVLAKSSTLPRNYQSDGTNRAVEDREALRAGELPLRLPNAPFILCDIDGTLADHIGTDPSNPLRSPFDEAMVLVDGCHERVAQHVRGVYATHNIVIISGRHDDCAEDTVTWLEFNNIPFDCLLMRSSGDNRSDAMVKPELLADLLTVVPKNQIAYVLDDRKRVIDAWKSAGLMVKVCASGDIIESPTWEHKDSCQFVLTAKKGYRLCPECGALEVF